MSFGEILVASTLLVLPGQGRMDFVNSGGVVDHFNWGLMIAVVDVGQADAIAIVEPGGTAIVIDAGHGSTAARKVAEFLRSDVDNGVGDIGRVKLGVVTHYDQDHVGGFASFDDERISFDAVIDQGPSLKRSGKAIYTRYLNWVGDPNDDVVQDANEPSFIRRRAMVGQDWTLGDAEVRVVSARGDTRGSAHDIELDPRAADIDENPGSIAVLVSLGDFEFYSAGDQTSDDWKGEPDTEIAVVQAGVLGTGESDVDVFKVNHHGSDTSNGRTFIEAIDPEVAIISSRLGGHGLPKRIAVKTLVDNGALVYITGNGLDANGELTDSNAVTEDDNWSPPPGSIINGAGNVYVLVSADGSRYRVLAGEDWREFSAVDSANIH